MGGDKVLTDGGQPARPAWWNTRRTGAGWDTQRRGQRDDPMSDRTEASRQDCSPWNVEILSSLEKFYLILATSLSR